MSTVGFIKRMVAAGFSYEDAMVAAEAFEAEVHDLTPVKSSGAIRQARYMAKKRHSASQNDGNDASDASLDKEVSPTPPSRNLSLVTPPYSPPPTGGDDAAECEKPVRGKIGRRKPETKIPDGFPDAEAVSAAQARIRAEGANLDAGAQAERFRNHAEQNDRRCRDWGAAWRNWVVGAIERAPKTAVASQPFNPQRAEDREAWWGRRVADYVKSRHWNEVDWGPRPGREGCHVPSQILESNGFLRMEMVG